MAKEEKVRQASVKIHDDIDILILHQATRYLNTGDRVLAELSKLHPSPPNPFKSLGLYLGQAVQIQPDAFKGRNNELQLLRDWLLPANHIRCQSLRRCGGNGGHGEDTILPGTCKSMRRRLIVRVLGQRERRNKPKSRASGCGQDHLSRVCQCSHTKHRRRKAVHRLSLTLVIRARERPPA